MDKKIKDTLKVLGLFIIFVISIFVVIAVSVNKNIYLIVKVITIILGVALSIFAFILISKINKRRVTYNKQDSEPIANTIYEARTKLCPKCRKAFDGNVCFYCGYKNGEK